MAGIAKQQIRSVSGRLIALTKAFGMQTTQPVSDPILLPNVATQLIDAMPIYDQLVAERDYRDAIWKDTAGKKTALIAKTELFVIDFFKVLKITINRSVKLNNGQWAASDINFYNLDETGGNIPDDMTESEALMWAEKIKDGEAALLLAKPTALAMTNPTAAEVTTAADEAKPYIAQTSQAQAQLNNTREELNEANVQLDALLETVWSYVEARYKTQPIETQREMLRNWGVVYATVGTPNTLTLLVKDSAGAPLEGADVVLLESDGTTSSNPEGRANLETRVVGAVTLRISFPGKANKDVASTIPDDAEGTTIDLGIVILDS